MTLARTETPGTAARLRLRILQTSDLHGVMRGFDYLADKPSETMGLARTATLIRAARAEAANCLLFDTGDFLQGSPVCDLVAENGLSRSAVHPVIAAMNALDYDAVTLGNHDFNHSAPFLFRALEDARFPTVSANFLDAAQGRPVLPPHAILKRDLHDEAGQRHSLRIGVVGCLPPQTIQWDHHLADDYRVSGMVASVRAEAGKMRAVGCDLIVVLAHCGIDPGSVGPTAENALIDLAALPEADVVLGGHTHMVFPGRLATPHPAIDSETGLIHGTPVLMPGFWGNHLGQADLFLEPSGAGWRVAAGRCAAIPLAHRDALGHIVETTPEDSALLDVTEPAHQATLAHIRQPVGETRAPLNSFFSLMANDASVQLVAAAQAEFLARAVADTELAGLPLLSCAAPFKTGRRSGADHYTHIPPGPLSRRGLADLYFYPNTVCAIRLSGHDLRNWLEHSASLFNHIPAGDQSDIALLNPGFPGYRFETVLGLNYEIDLSRPARFNAMAELVAPGARRIRNLRHEGRPVTDQQMFLLATNSYRAFGVRLEAPKGHQGPAPEIVYESTMANRDVLRDYVRRHSPLDPAPAPVWSFSALGGAKAMFETSPLARAYLGQPSLPPMQDLGDTPEGFARFRITL